MQLELYSDFVCPFCYVAERGPVRRLLAEYDVELSWHGFQLHPEVPPGGLRTADAFGAARAIAMHDRMQRFAVELGVPIGAPDRIPSTVRALALAEYARDRGAEGAVRDAAMDAHWLHGQDIESDATLTAIATTAGLDPAAALAAADDPAYRDRVAAARRDAHARMVTGIPTMFFGELMVVGCQPYATFERVAAKLGIPRRG